MTTHNVVESIRLHRHRGSDMCEMASKEVTIIFRWVCALLPSLTVSFTVGHEMRGQDSGFVGM